MSLIVEASRRGHEFSVEPYVDHLDMEAKLNDQARLHNGWKLAEVITCASDDKREYVTLVWSRPMLAGDE